ncbi:Ribosomal protein L12/ ATP-dependent Clp protease adaptor protein ClpS family protein [Heracleum sosnowskyi]|uniref:Large ribosomal subunit protein bL12c n=1 Tax=Heracleum sosnowskyi TaxID=360622 RepID=A0AAD8M696_9APIA|nr:Ribosomal protein L12/ ATP-dependent Clp protease adaptor protein ClpS family protein [Heracleum sosnowskyi]
MVTSIASKTLSRLFLFTHKTPLAQTLCTLTKPSEAQTQKLERIADELLSLSKLEKYDYNILLRHKMGLNRYGPAAVGLQSGAVSSGPATEVQEATEKLVFDVKIEKFDTSSKIKIIKEVRSFTDLGLKDAKALVEKVPVVVKKGLTKAEAEAISEKLKAVGATVVLE